MHQVHTPSLEVTLREHRPCGEPMTGSLGKEKKRAKAHQTTTLGLCENDKSISTITVSLECDM
jgi:hypothetical protein